MLVQVSKRYLQKIKFVCGFSVLINGTVGYAASVINEWVWDYLWNDADRGE